MIGLAMLAAATAATPELGFETGNKLYANCLETDARRLDCAGYVSGVSDTLTAMQSVSGREAYCPTVDVTRAQVRDVAIKYLAAHPEKRHYAAASLVMMALTEAFPCPK
jgi:hypothetical protein